MWKALWQKWTIDRPAMLGDWLWDIFVVQFAAFLNRLTLRLQRKASQLGNASIFWPQ